MLRQVILIADISDGSSSRDIALDLYGLFLNNKGSDPYFLYLGDQHETFKQHEDLKILDDIRDIENSIIIVMREFKAYYQIDRSNVVVYLTNDDVLAHYMAFILNRVDRVITTNYKAAYKLCAAIQQLNLYTPVHRIQPWFDVDKYKVRRHDPEKPIKIAVKGDSDIINALARSPHDIAVTVEGDLGSIAPNWTVSELGDLSQYDIYLHLSDEDTLHRAMLSGVVPITYNKLPFTEQIINCLNGFLITTESDLGGVIDELADRNRLQSYQAMTASSSRNTMSSEAWVKLFMNTVNGIGVENVNTDELFSTNFATQRRWIVPKTILRNGKKINIPRNYNKSRFIIVELDDLEAILEYFAYQRFHDVYIFDWSYGDAKDTIRKNKILNMARAFGQRGLNMFWCTNDIIPTAWADVFTNMSIIPVDAGLKKVKPA